MPKNPYKNLIKSMTICYTGARECDKCIHYDDTKYPECMQQLIKDACAVIVRCDKERTKLNNRIKRIEKDVYLGE